MTSRKDLFEIIDWIAAAGLAGANENELLEGFCTRLVGLGWPLFQGTLIIDTLHPLYEGRVFRWRLGEEDPTYISEYGRSDENREAAALWRESPFFQLDSSGESLLRRKIKLGEPRDFPVLADLAELGATDYVALVNRFGDAGVIGEMDCIYSSWTSNGKEGFSEDQVAALPQLVQHLALALRGVSLSRIASAVAETYLGRETGRRVLAGGIARGVAEKISAVIWFSDLKGFTRTSDASSPEEIIPFLNDYAEAVIDSLHDAGGEVLKLLGDGVLAIFNAPDLKGACGSALKAERILQARTAELNARRAENNLPVTAPYIALHVGEVFYGNIGSKDRLDFTVVGSAVNETSRIATLCRSVERDILVSPAFYAAACEKDRSACVSVGRYALRGVEQPLELYTLIYPSS